MSATKHAPGPWYYTYEGGGLHSIFGGTHTQGTPLIAQAEEGQGCNRKTAANNARLIVASPELKRLLAEAVAHLDDCTAGGWILEAKTLLKDLEAAQ